MIGCVTVSEDPGYHVLPMRVVEAALVYETFKKDLVRFVRIGYNGVGVSHYSPGLSRPVITSRVVQ